MAFDRSSIIRLFFVIVLVVNLPTTNSLHYDGYGSFSIYPRLDLHLCSNSSLSFDFTISSTASSSSSYNSSSYGRLLIYAEQQVPINFGSYGSSSSRKLVNSYFLVKLINGNRLVINDYWNVNDVTIQLPTDYLTSWFRFVYTRRLTTAEINLYRFEYNTRSIGGRSSFDYQDQPSIPKLVSVYSKFLTHSNFIVEELTSTSQSSSSLSSSSSYLFNDPIQAPYSQLLVGGIADNLNEKNFSYPHLKQLNKFHGYIMNLQYTSLSSQCNGDSICTSKNIAAQRQYAIFSSSQSKQYKLKQFVDRDSLTIDDICESDTLTHEICPKDCSCLSNNLVAPYFNCDCSDATTLDNSISKQQCTMSFKSFAINLDDSNYFNGDSQDKFEYPILPSFTKINVENFQTEFDKFKGVQFKSVNSYLYLSPNTPIQESDACFWNIDECSNGFVQHMIMSIDRLDEKKFNHKAIVFVNGQNDSSSSKLVAYLYKNRLHFSIYDYDENVEWLVSSFQLEKAKYLFRELKITLTWLKDKYLSLHFDGLLVDMITKPIASTINQDIYLTNTNLNRNFYEIGIKLLNAKTDHNGILVSQFERTSINSINHQFTLKYLRRDYYNDLDTSSSNGVMDSKIIVSSPLPSEIIKIDNTQRVMYKIDSPLTGVTTETIELAFKTSEPDGVIFYIRNNPIITYFELVHGQPVVVIDTRFKNVHLRPQSIQLNDNQWHEVKLHRDGELINIYIDSQYHDSADLGQSSNILTGGYVYLGLADPNNINLSDKKTFVGEMVRGKVTINNVQQKVIQQPYYYPSVPQITTNQTVNIDTSQLSADGKMINIIINVYGPPGFTAGVNAGVQKTDADTHYIYLDNLPDTRYVSVGPSDEEIDFRVSSTRLDSFLIKFQTRQTCGQLVTLVNDPRNFIGLEIFDGYLYSSTSINGASNRYQISRVRVDDGRIYQVNLKQEHQKILCWLDADDSYKQAIMQTNTPSIAVNTIRVAGQDGTSYGYSSRYGFVGCIGAILLNERDVIDYKFVSSERRQSCQDVIRQPQITTTTPEPAPVQPSPPAPPAPVSLGYISFSRPSDLLVYNFFYDHEKPCFEDISFIFRTVSPNGILFSAHNADEGQQPHLIGAYIRDGLVHVIYLNSSYTQDLCFDHTTVDDGNLYRLNIRRNSNGQGFIQLQSYVGVTALDFYTQQGQIKFSKIIVGGADEWSRVRFYGTRPDFVGCIIDLFQVNGNSVIKPAEIPNERYNCNVERPRPPTTTSRIIVAPRPQRCLPHGYTLSFSSVEDAVTYQHETKYCEHINIPFRTREGRGIIYSHTSEDCRNYIIVFLRRGFVNIIIKDNISEKELELDCTRVDDGELHEIDIQCESSSGYLVAYVDKNRQVTNNRIELSSSLALSSYTLGYFDTERLSSKYSIYDNFRGCLEQISFNKECLIYESMADRNRLTCSVQPIPTPAPILIAQPKLRCAADPHDPSTECSTDGVCYAALWRNSSGVVERFMKCFTREQLQPLDNPFLCRSQDPTRYVIKCCDSDYCNRNLRLNLKEVDEREERSVWRFRGPNSGDLKFVPYLSPSSQGELAFQINATRLDGTIMCTKDESTVLKTEFKDGNVHLTLSDLKSRRTLKSVMCRSSGIQFSDNKWHRISLSKKSRGQVTISCDDGSSQMLQHDIDIPFVNTKYGVSFGLDCSSNDRRFTGDISNIFFTHNGFCYSLDDLQYSEDSRLTYEGYVEFRPKYSGEIYSDPKPIKFRSKTSSARINKWDDAKVGRISFEFKTEINDENGVIFSTESAGSYFAIVLNNGYLESILSPHRVQNADSSSDVSFYDRFQRLFPFPRTKVNNGQWHKFEFMMIDESVASLVLDDDFSTKIRFPMAYWNDESSIVFGTNTDIQRDLKTDLSGSFRGCIRNIVINNRLIDWSSKAGGILFNIEAGCYNDKLVPNQLPFLINSRQSQLEAANNKLQFNGDGCVRYNSNLKGSYSDRETVEFSFKTQGDRMILFDSLSGEFIIHTQGPSIVIRAKDESSTRYILERGVAFNDGEWHRVKIEKYDTRIDIEIDGKYRQQPEFILSKRGRLGPFYAGCSRNSKLNIRLVELQDFRGQIQNFVYYTNGDYNNRCDLIERLIDNDPNLLIDGQVQWTVGSKGDQRVPSSSNAVTLRDLSSFLKIERLNEFDINSNLSFTFKTTESDGLIAFISPGPTSTSSFIAVELTDGHITLLSNLGNQLRRVTCSPSQPPLAIKYNDNKWHTISIKRDRLGDSRVENSSPTSTLSFGCDNNYVRVKVSDSSKFPLTQFSSGNITQSQTQSLAHSLWLSKSPKFLGCIGNLRLNQREIDIYQATIGESRSNLIRGCQDSSPICKTSSGLKCMNQGECVDGYGRSYCNCDSKSFTGQRCELAASTLSFNGSHGLEYAVRDPTQSSSEDVFLRFKTRLRNGVLFTLKKSPHEPSLVISLEDGRAKCVYDREINDKVIYVGDHNQFNNNKWHTLHVRRHGSSVLLEVIDNEKNRYYAIDDLNINFIHVNYRYVNIGSTNSRSLSQEHPNFIGWIQNVRFNGEDLVSPYLNGRNVPQWSTGVSGLADSGESTLLLHHQITFSSACPINLPRISSSERFNIHLFFKTSHPSGVIFFRRGKELFPFMALELSDGILRFVFDLGGGLKVLESEKSIMLNDKNWHEVTIKRFDRQKFSMKIDDYKELLIDIGSNSRPLYELESFVIGGVMPEYQKFVKDILGNKGFVGCLASLEINNDAPNLYSNLLTVCPSVLQGCFDSACYPNPCYNNGNCSIGGVNQVACNCDMTSYAGQFCRDDSVFHFFGGQSKKCGIIKYTLVPAALNQESDRLAFGFTTVDLEGTLVKIESDTGDQFIEIKLKDGQLVLAVNINGIVETRNYQTGTGERFDDNRYHVVQFKRDRNDIQFRVDNFEQLEFILKGNSGVFRNQLYIYSGATIDSKGTLLNCFYGILSGMVFNGHRALDNGISSGDVIISNTKYIDVDESNSTHVITIMADGSCPLGYLKDSSLCNFAGCPIYSDFLGDYSCRCFYGYYQKIAECVKANETKLQVVDNSAKFIPAKARIAETPIGLILGIISGILLAILAAIIGARKCADGLCIPAKRYRKVPVTTAAAVSQIITGTATTTNDSYEASSLIRKEEQQIPLMQRNEQFMRNEEYYRDALDFGYKYPQPIFTQSVNETMEMFEQTSGAAAAATTTTYNTGTISHSAHHASHRDLAMDSLFYSQNNAADYELSNVTCVTMTPNGKYAIIGQSMGTPQIWDTISGLLVRSMAGINTHCSNLTLCCNGTYLVGLTNDGSCTDGFTQALQIWEVQTGKPIQMSHQIKCCVFTQSIDTNSIFMAGNQRFGRGISVGILDLVTNELTKEIKSDPTISFGESPESVVITPDERHAIVGCRSANGTNFVVFDITKSNEIAQTRSISLDADPKCIQVLNNSEVLTGTRGGHLIQWNIHSCKPTASYVDPNDSQAHRGPINSISLSCDKEHLVSASSDCTSKVWNTATKNLVSVCSGHRGEVTCASISNNDLVVTGSTDQTVGLWRLYSGNQISSMSVGMNLVEANMARHNKTIVAIGEKEGEQQLLMLRVINVQR